MNELIYKELSYKLRGIFFDIQNELGTKFQEKHYCQAIATQLQDKNIPFQREFPLTIMYRGKLLGKFKADFIIDNLMLLEIKTTDKISIENIKQIIRYLDASHLKLGLVVNFRVRPLEIKRIVN